MPTIVSRMERRVPAARIAPNEEPYSTTRPSCLFHQTRCGMWCRSGCAPVTIEVRQTGVSDGKVVTPRLYSPASASSDSVGADRSPTACSNTDGVSPSMTTRIAPRLFRKRAKSRVLLPGASTGTKSEGGDGQSLEKADEGDQREREDAERRPAHENYQAARGCASPYGAAREHSCAETAESSSGASADRGLPVEDEPGQDGPRDQSDERGCEDCARGPREQSCG